MRVGEYITARMHAPLLRRAKPGGHFLSRVVNVVDVAGEEGWLSPDVAGGRRFVKDLARDMVLSASSERFVGYHPLARVFPRMGAGRAKWLLTFTRDTVGSPTGDIAIPPGTRAGDAGATVVYRTIVHTVIPDGQTTVQAPAVCDTTGDAGNVAVLAIDTLIDGVTGVDGVSNADAGDELVHAADAETNNEWAQRLIECAATLEKLGTKAGVIEAFAKAGVTLDIEERWETYGSRAAWEAGDAAPYDRPGFDLFTLEVAGLGPRANSDDVYALVRAWRPVHIRAEVTLAAGSHLHFLSLDWTPDWLLGLGTGAAGETHTQKFDSFL